MVTKLPRGFFSKSSSNRSSPTIFTALGKLSVKNLAASSLVEMLSSEAKGRNRVRVNEPS